MLHRRVRARRRRPRLLLARAGIDVVVVEKHGDFLRDFRGDTIHPSTCCGGRFAAVSTADLAAVQRRREITVRLTQTMQAFMQRQLLVRNLRSTRQPSISPVMRIFMRMPGVRTLMPRLVALGVQRPHVESPEIAAAPN